ncbi:hypothetical protein DSECCO2_554320 [anaerobic digester metagenome]
MVWKITSNVIFIEKRFIKERKKNMGIGEVLSNVFYLKIKKNTGSGHYEILNICIECGREYKTKVPFISGYCPWCGKKPGEDQRVNPKY